MADPLEIMVAGGDVLKAALGKFGADVQIAAAAALYQQGETIRGEAQALAPVGGQRLNSKGQWKPGGTPGGTLKNSAFVTEPQFGEGTVFVTIGFGGAASAYVVRQHEDLTFRHRVGQAKFLEQPLLLRAKTFVDDLGASIGKALGR